MTLDQFNNKIKELGLYATQGSIKSFSIKDSVNDIIILSTPNQIQGLTEAGKKIKVYNRYISDYSPEENFDLIFELYEDCLMAKNAEIN